MNSTEHSESLENKKDDLDYQRFQLEKRKNISDIVLAWVTTLSLIFGVVIPLITIAVNVNSQTKQARHEFELKAAEIVMNTTGPTGTLNRAKAMANMFPDRLPSNFAASFDPKEYTGDNTNTPKKELIQLLVEHPDQRAKIIETWKKLFPDHEWINDVPE
jgi:hypothetical protein